MSGGGRTIATGTLSIRPTSFLATLDGRTLDNAGSAVCSTPLFTAVSGAVVHNLPGAMWAMQVANSYSPTFPLFDNAGAFRKQGSGQLLIGGAFVNSGEVDVEAGTLNLFSYGTSSGHFVTAEGATLGFTGGVQTLGPCSTVSGPGSVAFDGGVANVAGGFSITGTTQVAFDGTVNFLSNVTLANLQVSASVDGAALNAWGMVTVAGAFAWARGTLGGGGTIRAAGGLAISGHDSKILDGVHLINAGIATRRPTQRSTARRLPSRSRRPRPRVVAFPRAVSRSRKARQCWGRPRSTTRVKRSSPPRPRRQGATSLLHRTAATATSASAGRL
jgi:hypothetical protein